MIAPVAYWHVSSYQQLPGQGAVLGCIPPSRSPCTSNTFVQLNGRVRVPSRSGRAPLPHDAGLKHTISLRPGESAEIITRFDGHRGRYLFHCHNAEH
jgi:FtsP/CotA-like multicopper oxidase with cupredoxin domain